RRSRSSPVVTSAAPSSTTSVVCAARPPRSRRSATPRRADPALPVTQSPEQHTDDPRSPRRPLLVAAGVAVLALVLLRFFVVETFTGTSDSMEPTLREGDRLVVLKTTTVERGDLVVFDGTRLLGPTPTTASVKRVIGVPGDRVTCCTEDGRLSRNGA